MDARHNERGLRIATTLTAAFAAVSVVAHGEAIMEHGSHDRGMCRLDADGGTLRAEHSQN